jgi:nucleoside-diphosphate-sugar epimerase
MALIKKLVGFPHEILVIANPDSERNERLSLYKSIRIIECNLYEYDTIDLGEKYDVFFHFAWIGGHCRSDLELNMKSATCAMDAVRLAHRLGCTTFIGAGSQAECGQTISPIDVNTVCKPDSAFGAAKLYAYNQTRKISENFGLNFYWARILSIYGPYDRDGSLVMSTILRVLNKQSLAFTSGNQIWDFLYADDAADALFAISKHGKPDSIYVIGSGDARELRDYIKELLEEFNLDANQYLGLVPYSDNQVMHLVANTDPLRQEFNWKPKIPFRRGIQLTIEYCNRLKLI